MTSVERAFPALLQDFFHRRLVAQRGASAHTIASYRDTFTLFLGYAAQRIGRTPSALTVSDLDAPMVLDFLDHLETERGNSPRSRNLRLTAIRSFMRYASLREPTLLPIAQRVLAIPVKRFDRPVLGYLSREEITAIIDAPDRTTWSGQRDAVLFAVLYNTGARVSEMIRLLVADVLLDRASSLLLHGKGRKERVVPLWKSTAAQLRAWLPRIDRSPGAPVFPNRAGKTLSRSGVEHQLRVACRKASQSQPSLAIQRISPHTLPPRRAGLDTYSDAARRLGLVSSGRWPCPRRLTEDSVLARKGRRKNNFRFFITWIRWCSSIWALSCRV